LVANSKNIFSQGEFSSGFTLSSALIALTVACTLSGISCIYTSVVVAARECSEKSLNVIRRSLLLRQHRYRAPDHLEGQFRQFEALRQFVEHPPAVAGVHERPWHLEK
jgi:hypothetical protein